MLVVVVAVLRLLLKAHQQQTDLVALVAVVTEVLVMLLHLSQLPIEVQKTDAPTAEVVGVALMQTNLLHLQALAVLAS